LKLISFGVLGLCFPRWVLLLLGTHLELLPIPRENLVLCLTEWTAQALVSLLMWKFQELTCTLVPVPPLLPRYAELSSHFLIHML